MTDDIPAKLEDLKPGTKVKCIFKHNSFHRYGELATIVYADIDNIQIKWDDGYAHDVGWGFYESFSVVSSSGSAKTDSATIINDHCCPCCPCCGDKRVSKSEKTCWVCGGNLH
jgi:hypothetical protein